MFYANITQSADRRSMKLRLSLELTPIHRLDDLAMSMSCVRESSPPLQDAERHDSKKRRFLQRIRRVFRRKERTTVAVSDCSSDAALRSSQEQIDHCEEATNLEPVKSQSTSHLTDDITDNAKRRSLQSMLLSVSHDSVFTTEQRSQDSCSETSLYPQTRLGFPAHSSIQAELFEVVRRRLVDNTSDDEDLGLPRSPVSSSPTTADDIFSKGNVVTKSSQSTCSDGSLLSMVSSEIDEDSYGHSSRNSSKLSLDRRTSFGSEFTAQQNDTSISDTSASSLSHSAAKHKMAIKPKRNHGAPHKKRPVVSSTTLPVMPELNEDNVSKANIPEDRRPEVAASELSDEHKLQTFKEHIEYRTCVTKVNCIEYDHKFVSLPPIVDSSSKVARSRSNVAHEHVTFDDIAKEKEKKDEPSFFSRLLLRRSSKKKKMANEDEHRFAEEHINDHMVHIKHANEQEKEDKMKSRLRQRVEPQHIQEGAPFRYTANVPVNMLNQSSLLKKSHSFRNQEKLPLSYDDMQSLPVNLGLIDTVDPKLHQTDDSATDDTISVNNTLSNYSSLLDSSDDNSTHEVDHSIDKSSTSPEYVGLVEAKMPDVKIPIPAPRMSLLKSIDRQMEVNYVNTIPTADPCIDNVECVSVCNRSTDDIDSDVFDDSIASAAGESEFNQDNHQTLDASEQSNKLNHLDETFECKMSVTELNVVDVEQNFSTVSTDITEHSAQDKQRESIGDVVWPVEHSADKLYIVESTDKIPIVNESNIYEVANKTELSTVMAINEENLNATEIEHSKTDIYETKFNVWNEKQDIKVEPYHVQSNGNVAYKNTNGRKSVITIIPDIQDEPVVDLFNKKSMNKNPNSDQIAELTSKFIENEKHTDSQQRSKYCEYRKEYNNVRNLIHKSDIDRDGRVEIAKRNGIRSNGYIFKKVDEKRCDELDKHEKDQLNVEKSNDKEAEVVLRKRSSTSKDDEPELMKVFARRSLKLKESDLDEILPIRDSDKENEAVVENVQNALKPAKYQRSLSNENGCVLTTNIDKRQRCKSVPNDEESNFRFEKPIMCLEKPSLCMEKPAALSFEKPNLSFEKPSLFIEKPALSFEKPSLFIEKPCLEKAVEEEKNVTTPYKRIQQRREEWEKRAQQAMKTSSK